jgi:hypothetical protein
MFALIVLVDRVVKSWDNHPRAKLRTPAEWETVVGMVGVSPLDSSHSLPSHLRKEPKIRSVQAAYQRPGSRLAQAQLVDRVPKVVHDSFNPVVDSECMWSLSCLNYGATLRPNSE